PRFRLPRRISPALTHKLEIPLSPQRRRRRRVLFSLSACWQRRMGRRPWFKAVRGQTRPFHQPERVLPSCRDKWVPVSLLCTSEPRSREQQNEQQVRASSITYLGADLSLIEATKGK